MRMIKGKHSKAGRNLILAIAIFIAGHGLVLLAIASITAYFFS